MLKFVKLCNTGRLWVKYDMYMFMYEQLCASEMHRERWSRQFLPDEHYKIHIHPVNVLVSIPHHLG